MTEKELRNLGRADLLEMLIESEKCRAAEEQRNRLLIDELNGQIAQLTDRLNSREISIEECGDLAEACLRLNEVFESAQKASEQYLDNIRSRKANTDMVCDQMILECQKKSLAILQETQEKCALMQAKVQEESVRILREAKDKRLQTEEECRQMKLRAKMMADKYYEEKNGKLQAVLDAYATLESLMGSDGKDGCPKISTEK